MNRWSERLLVRGILAGDRNACARLVRIYHAPVYRFLVHLTRDAHAAEDLTQDTFAAAWAGMNSFTGLSSLATWFHRIAYRKFVDAYRRKKSTYEIETSFAPDSLEANRPNPLEEVLADEQKRRLYQAMNRLENANREVVILHYLQGLSFSEMSHVLDTPVGTVKWRTSQALSRLRTLLDGECEHGIGPAGQIVGSQPA